MLVASGPGSLVVIPEHLLVWMWLDLACALVLFGEAAYFAFFRRKGGVRWKNASVIASVIVCLLALGFALHALVTYQQLSPENPATRTFLQSNYLDWAGQVDQASTTLGALFLLLLVLTLAWVCAGIWRLLASDRA